MSQPNPPAPKKTGCPMGCVILTLLLMVLIVGGIGVFLFLTLNAPPPTNIWANISSPADGYLAEINVPLTVQAAAQHSSGIVRVEIYADGALVLAQNSAQPNGSNPLVLLQSWAPLATGRHILTARAYTRDGKFGDSSVVNLDVVKLRDPTVTLPVETFPHEGTTLPSLNQISSGTGIPLPRLVESNPDLSGSDPNVPLPSGTDVNVPRSPASPPSPDTRTGSDSSSGAPPPLPDAPDPPTSLSANADCTRVQLTWRASPNAEQYVISRLAPGESVFSPPLATLPAGAPSYSYSDPISILGEYQYRVAAVRRGLEGSIQATARTPDSCAPDIGTPPRLPDLLLTFISIDTVTAYPGIYCYITVDGRAEHVPSGDFNRLMHDADGLHYDLRLLDNRGQLVLAHADSELVTLEGDCYGLSTVGFIFRYTE